jgi:methylenetetrahydrofolate dehydrogenase (NADP+)/methenyltetrahydrofolate cyclohydrolase
LIERAKIIDGRLHANSLGENIKSEVSALNDKGITPCIAIILIGHDPGSEIYVNVKIKKAKELGIKAVLYKYEELDQANLLELVESLNQDDAVHGILVQLPLPGGISVLRVLRSISPSKDVDGFHPYNAGLLTTGDDNGFVPCTPRGCLYLLNHHLGSLDGLNAAVIGRSNIVGKPMFNLLEKNNCTTTLCHSHTKDLKYYTINSDIVVCAVGKANYLDKSYFKAGVTVIDVGMNRLDIKGENGRYKLTGDVKFDEVKQIAGHITPVPGGVGPMTVISLMQNTIQAAKLNNNRG